MNKLQTFNFGQNEVRTLAAKGEPHFVLADVCNVLEIKNSRDVVNRLDPDEKGVGQIYTLGGNQKMTIINESGLYAVILRSDKPQAKQFRKWVTSEVLPSLRKTGTYTVKPVDDYKVQLLTTRQDNVRIRKAQLLYKISKDCTIESYRTVLQSHITQMLTGQTLLPLPLSAKQTYSAQEIGEMLGITANRIGSLTNKFNLKTEQYGEWVWDKSRYSPKEVRTFRYYIEVVAKLKEVLKEVA